MMAAFAYVASGGRLVFVGLFQGDVTFHDPDFHRRELTLLSSRSLTLLVGIALADQEPRLAISFQGAFVRHATTRELPNTTGVGN